MRILIKPILLTLVLILVSSCGNSEGDPEKENAYQTVSNSDDSGINISFAQFEGSEMELGTIKESTFPIIVEATGMIDVPPENRAMVSSYADGYVKQTPLLIGDEVKKGQFLLSLENPEYVQLQQDYLDAMEQMNFLRSDYERQKTLLEENITSKKSFLKSESEYKRNLARYQGIRKKLQMLNIDPNEVEKGNISSVIRIYSPISGSITKMKINNGMYVSAADELIEIINRDHLHIELNVFEKDILKLKKGQDIRFNVSEANTNTIQGEVHLIGTSINEENRTVKVHGHFKDEQNKKSFATGMFVDAEIITDKKKEKALPTESIVSLDNTNYVLVLKKKTESGYLFSRHEVLPGDDMDGYTVIQNSSDFKQDDQFLIKGAFPLIKE